MIVDALGRGDQSIILRKGGIAEGPGGFRVAHDRFLLFPTRFHQQRERVVPAAQARLDALLADDDTPADRVRIEFLASVTGYRHLTDPAAVDLLAPFHRWRPEVLRERFEWGREAGVTLMGVRVERLPQALEMPLRPEDGGCRSWTGLAEEIDGNGARPVLDGPTHEARMDALARVIGGWA